MKKIAILLAADETRMRSKLPAAQHRVCGKAMADYVSEAARKAGAEEICMEESFRMETLEDEQLICLVGSAMPLVQDKDIAALGWMKATELKALLTAGKSLRAVFEQRLSGAHLSAERALEVCDRVQLAKAEKLMRARINERLMLAGVTMIDPENTYIEDTVVIGQDTVVYPGCTLQGETVIGENCVIYPHCRMNNAVVGDGTTVEASVLLDCRVGRFTTVGPNAYLRPKTVIGDHCRIGDFVEVKNSSIGNRTKVSHLTYVGDADLGENINLGCGVVFSNYDGKKKYRSVIGDNAFIGCNVNIVSPVSVGEDAYIAAGSTITGDVPGAALAIARERQTNKEGWVETRKAEGKL